MRRIAAHPLPCFLAIAIAALVIRLATSVARTETGLNTVRALWSCATAGIVGRNYYWISEADPTDQAEFWLAESRRILEADNRPELALGAAWVLDHPGRQELWCQPRSAQMFAGLDRWLHLAPVPLAGDEIGPHQRAELFELLCRGECLATASSLTKTAPDNSEFWRTLAWLHSRLPQNDTSLQPRSARWLETLEECAARDPENALYDYLAAVQLWNESAKSEFAGGETSISVSDSARFELGWQRFAAGQAKPRLISGPAVTPDVMEFLERARIPALARVRIAERRPQDASAFELKHRLFRWLRNFSDASETRSRMSAMDPPANEYFRLIEQMAPEDSDSEANFGYPLSWISRPAWWTRYATLISSPEQFTADEAQTIRDSFRSALLNYEERDFVGRQIQERFKTELCSLQTQSVLVWSVETLCLLGVTIFVVSSLLFNLTRQLGKERPEHAHSTLWRDAFLWLIALALTFLIRGALPAGTFGKEFPAWISRELLLASPLLLLVGIVALLFRRAQFSAVDVFAVGVSALTAVALVTQQETLLAHLAKSQGNAILLAVTAIITAGGLWYCVQRSMRFWLNKRVPAAARCYVTAICVAAAVWQIVGSPMASDFLETHLRVGHHDFWLAGRLKSLFQLKEYPLRLAWVHWASQGGIPLTLLGVAILTAMDFGLLSWRTRRQRANQRIKVSWCTLTAGFCRRISRLTLRVVTVAALAFLILAPLLIDRTEQHYRSRLAYLEDPSLFQKQYEDALAELRMDEVSMAPLRERVAEIEQREIMQHTSRANEK